MKPIRERINEALKDGPLEYRVLARAVFPPDQYPRAWNYKTEGGPPGCFMSLTPAIERHGFVMYSDGKRRYVRRPTRKEKASNGHQDN